MGKSQEAPQSPDPRVTIPLQGAENRRTFDYQLQGMRTNTRGPTGSQTWTQTPTFDQAGYNAAMEQFRQQGGNPGQAPQPPQSGRGEMVWDDQQGESGRWVEVPSIGGSPGGSRYAIEPSRDAFTSNQWTLNTELSPEQQALYDSNVQSQLGQSALLGTLTDRTRDAVSQPLDWSQLPDLQSQVLGPSGQDRAGEFSNISSGLRSQMAALDPRQINQEAADSIYRLNTRYMDPQMQQAEQAMQARLSDQGFTPGTPAYEREMDLFRQSRERGYADARDRATVGGVSAGSQMFGNSMQSLQAQIAAALQGAQFGANQDTQRFNQALAGQQQGNNVRNQAIAEMLQQRNYPLNELNAFRSGTQVQMPTGPTSSPTPNLSPVDIQGTFNQDYQNQLGAYNANVAGNNDLFGSLLSLGGAAMGTGGIAPLLAMFGNSGGGNPLYQLPSSGARFGGGG